MVRDREEYFRNYRAKKTKGEEEAAAKKEKRREQNKKNKRAERARKKALKESENVARMPSVNDSTMETPSENAGNRLALARLKNDHSTSSRLENDDAAFIQHLEELKKDEKFLDEEIQQMDTEANEYAQRKKSFMEVTYNMVLENRKRRDARDKEADDRAKETDDRAKEADDRAKKAGGQDEADLKLLVSMQEEVDREVAKQQSQRKQLATARKNNRDKQFKVTTVRKSLASTP